MTERETLIEISRLCAIALVGAPTPQPPGPVPQPPAPTPQPPPPGRGVPVPPSADYTFNWDNVGHPEPWSFSAGQRATFKTDVPAGYRGSLAFVLVQLAREFESMNVEFWVSASPGGEPIAGTHYKGSWIGGTLGGAEFGFKPAAGPFWFNVVAGVSQTFGVQQDHQ